jgi:hypothetical protein
MIAESYPSWFGPRVLFEDKAARIHEWEMRGIPGLLQTRSYTCAVIRTCRPYDSGDELERDAAARVERQNILMRDDPPTRWVVLSEGVLRQAVGGVRVMREQLDHLLSLAEAQGIVLQILPLLLQRPPDHRPRIRPPRQELSRKKNMRSPAGPAPRTPRDQHHVRPLKDPDQPLRRVPPRRNPAHGGPMFLAGDSQRQRRPGCLQRSTPAVPARPLSDVPPGRERPVQGTGPARLAAVPARVTSESGPWDRPHTGRVPAWLRVAADDAHARLLTSLRGR